MSIATPAIGTVGMGNIIFNAQDIDFTGAVLADESVANATFNARGDIRLTLRALGAAIVEERAYEDHHAYTAAEFARLRARAKAENATLVTTEKDFVRLTPAEREDVRFIPVRAVRYNGLER